MAHRNLLLPAILALGLTGIADAALAQTIAVPDVASPTRGMSMHQVASKFGAPVAKVPAVGRPPISRWQYPGFVVYFEYQIVIHSVAANS